MKFEELKKFLTQLLSAKKYDCRESEPFVHNVDYKSTEPPPYREIIQSIKEEKKDILAAYNAATLDAKKREEKKFYLDFFTCLGIWAAAYVAYLAICEADKSSNKQYDVMEKQLNQMAIDNRAWVSAVFAVSDDLTYDTSGGKVGLTIILKNTGHSPAYYVAASAEMLQVPIVIKTANVNNVNDKVCEDAIKLGKINGVLIFPGDKMPFNAVIHISPDQLTRAIRNTIGPFIFTCVAYHLQGDPMPHFSVMNFDLLNKGRGFFTPGVPVKANDIQLEVAPMYPGYAN